MHDLPALMRLAASLRDRRMLSVYLGPATTDPARRHMWQIELDNAITALRARLEDASHAERAALDDAIARLAVWLSEQDAVLRSPGLVAFVSPERVEHAAPLAFAVTTHASWADGIHLAPLLKEASSGAAAGVLVVDTKTAQLYRYEAPDTLDIVERLASALDIEVSEHMSGPVGSFHPATRGPTGTDEAERQVRAGRDRLFRDAVAKARKTAGDSGWIVIGGNPRSVAAASPLVPQSEARRVISIEHLDVHASETEIVKAVQSAIADREAARDRAMVEEMLDESAARGRSVAGLSATRVGLERAAVAELVLTERFVTGHPAETDDMVSAALSQGASVRQVERDAAEELDSRAGGVVARLRYAAGELAMEAISPNR